MKNSQKNIAAAVNVSEGIQAEQSLLSSNKHRNILNSVAQSFSSLRKKSLSKSEKISGLDASPQKNDHSESDLSTAASEKSVTFSTRNPQDSTAAVLFSNQKTDENSQQRTVPFIEMTSAASKNKSKKKLLYVTFKEADAEHMEIGIEKYDFKQKQSLETGREEGVIFSIEKDARTSLYNAIDAILQDQDSWAKLYKDLNSEQGLLFLLESLKEQGFSKVNSRAAVAEEPLVASELLNPDRTDPKEKLSDYGILQDKDLRDKMLVCTDLNSEQEPFSLLESLKEKGFYEANSRASAAQEPQLVAAISPSDAISSAGKIDQPQHGNTIASGPPASSGEPVRADRIELKAYNNGVKNQHLCSTAESVAPHNDRMFLSNFHNKLKDHSDKINTHISKLKKCNGDTVASKKHEILLDIVKNIEKIRGQGKHSSGTDFVSDAKSDVKRLRGLLWNKKEELSIYRTPPGAKFLMPIFLFWRLFQDMPSRVASTQLANGLDQDLAAFEQSETKEATLFSKCVTGI